MHGVIGLGQTALRNRRGRKRKQGRRSETNNRLAPAQLDYRAMAANQPHRREMPEDQRLDPLAENPLGKLRLRGVITDEQLEAGRLFSIRVGEFRAVVKSPRGTGQGVGRGFNCPTGGCGDENEDCACQGRWDRYIAAHDALARAGRLAVVMVKTVAIHGEPCPPSGIESLKDGLTALENHFGLKARGKSRIVAGSYDPGP